MLAATPRRDQRSFDDRAVPRRAPWIDEDVLQTFELLQRHA
jgi:hypothetical protein